MFAREATGAVLVEDLVAFARDAACRHGFVVRPALKEPKNSELVTHLPFTLFPTPVKREVYLQAVRVQSHFNTLVDRVSQDADFLEEALASPVKVDAFTARPFGIHKQVQREGKSPSVVLGLNRSDYMLDQTQDESTSLKQIEINTIAAGFGGLASAIVRVHKDILRAAGRPEESHGVRGNDPAAGQAKAMAKAWELCGNIPMIRRSFSEVLTNGSLDQDDRLFVDGKEIAVVYFMNGYVPQQYKSEEDWEARLLIERSRAVKCPDIATHLAGTKKVQQALSRPHALERFLPDQPHAVEQGPEGDRTVEMALAAPERFVLKPQRGGGGNNIYGADICKVLEEATGEQRSAYILMDKILSTPSPNVVLKPGSPSAIIDCLSELGVYGAYVRHGAHTVMNEAVGHLLRTKMASCSDGGVMAGVAGLDNPLLY